MDYTIRPIQAGDGEGLNRLRRMPGVFETILGLPSERISGSEAFVSGMGENDHQFVAVVAEPDGKELIIGSAGISVNGCGRMRHSAGFGIMVHRDYQDQGVGSALMTTVLDIADNWLKLVRVELTVYADNHRAIHVYKKHGFEEEGVRRMAAIRHGEYVDELAMARLRP